MPPDKEHRGSDSRQMLGEVRRVFIYRRKPKSAFRYLPKNEVAN
jgi:hypothetical protein